MSESPIPYSSHLASATSVPALSSKRPKKSQSIASGFSQNQLTEMDGQPTAQQARAQQRLQQQQPQSSHHPLPLRAQQLQHHQQQMPQQQQQQHHHQQQQQQQQQQLLAGQTPYTFDTGSALFSSQQRLLQQYQSQQLPASEPPVMAYPQGPFSAAFHQAIPPSLPHAAPLVVKCDCCTLDRSADSLIQINNLYRVCQDCISFYRECLSSQEYRIHLPTCPVPTTGQRDPKQCYGCLYEMCILVGMAQSNHPAIINNLQLPPQALPPQALPPQGAYQPSVQVHFGQLRQPKPRPIQRPQQQESQQALNAPLNPDSESDTEPYPPKRRKAKKSAPFSADADKPPAAQRRKHRGRPPKSRFKNLPESPSSTTGLATERKERTNDAATSLQNTSTRTPFHAVQSSVLSVSSSSSQRTPEKSGGRRQPNSAKRGTNRGFCIGCWKTKELEERYAVAGNIKFSLCNACRKTHLTKHVIPTYEQFTSSRSSAEDEYQRRIVRDELELLWSATNREPCLFRLLDLWLNIDWRRALINGVAENIEIEKVQDVVGEVIGQLLSASVAPPPIGTRQAISSSKEESVTENGNKDLSAEGTRRSSSWKKDDDSVPEGREDDSPASRRPSSPSGQGSSEATGTGKESPLSRKSDGQLSEKITPAYSEEGTARNTGKAASTTAMDTAEDGSATVASDDDNTSEDADATAIASEKKPAQQADGPPLATAAPLVRKGEATVGPVQEEMLRIFYIRIAGVMRPVVVPLIPTSKRNVVKEAIEDAIIELIGAHLKMEMEENQALVAAIETHKMSKDKIFPHRADISILFAIE